MNKIGLLALCIFVAFLPWEMMAYSRIVSGAKAAGLLCIVGAAISFLAGHSPRLFSRLIALRVALAVYMTISVLWSFEAADISDTILRVGQLLVLVVLIWEIAVSYNDQLWLMRSFLVGMSIPLAMQVVTLGSLSRQADAESARISGGGQDANYLALMLTVSLVMAVYLATNETKSDRWFRWFYWGYVVAALLGTLLTGSRGGLLCLFTAIFFGVRLAGVKKMRFAIRWIIRFAVAGVIAFFFTPRSLVIRFSQIFEGGADTFAQREGYWSRGLYYCFLKYPLQGVGLGAYSSATTALSGEKTGVAHNIFVSVLVELGLIGFVLFVVFLIVAYRAAWRMPRRESWLALGLLTVWLVGAMSSGSQMDKFSWFIQALVATMAVACTQIRSARRPNPATRPPLKYGTGGLRPRWGRP